MKIKKVKRKKRAFIPGAKLLRCLQMIAHLSDSRMTIKEMAERFDMSERTAYRYIDLFEAVGYCIDRDFNGKVFIFAGPIVRPEQEPTERHES